MQSRTIDFLIKPTKELFNADKVPHQQLTEEQIEAIVKSQFYYFKEFSKRPFHWTLRLPKFLTVKLRYRYIRAKIADNIRLAKRLKKELNTECIDIIQQEVEANKIKIILEINLNKLPKEFEDIGLYLSQLDIENKKNRYEEALNEIRYWWIIKQQYMKAYTSTPKYKRLQALRAAWQNSNKQLTYKEDYQRNRLTQMGQDDEENEAYKLSIHKEINKGVKGNKRVKIEK